ncbi:MAG: DUF2141 domain-containing protein [Rhodocyclaceae bacterium]
MTHTARSVAAISLMLASAAASAAELSVRFKGVPSDKGTVMAALYASESAYAARQALRKVRLPANAPLVAVFKDLPAGRYALTAFHDENGNGTLDTAANGMPTEAYGFSRNPAVRYGPPSFADMSFDVGPANPGIDILME